MAKILIIGSRGYIGTELMKHLDADGIDKGSTWWTAGYDTIILLAGHSSVAMGENDPDGCWRNNVESFKKLLDGLRDNQRLIYASSGSVYHNKVENMYDLSKHIIDQLALLSGKNVYGMRLATVNGYSDVLRADLMLNKMVESAKNHGVVTIKNKDLVRPLLDMQDLVRAVKAILNGPDQPGLYNLASFPGDTVEHYAQAVIQRFGGEIVYEGSEPHYEYKLDTKKFEQAYNFQFSGTVPSILTSLEKEPKQKVVRT